MQKRLLIGAGILIALLVLLAGALALRPGQPGEEATSPYVDQLSSHIRGLSPQEIDDLLNGRGAGYARTAELNSYPGPLHALDLKEELALSPQQVEQIEAVFDGMQADAKRIGQEIVHKEGQLSFAFANKTISEADLQARTGELADLYGELRATHLLAHLQITPLLSAEQIARYNELRGYTGTPGSPGEQHDPGRHPQSP